MDGSAISGPGYSVQVPSGFSVAVSVPLSGYYRLLPPGVSQFDIQALLQIRPVMPFELQALLQNVYSFLNPNVAWMNAMNLGLVNVYGILPVRQMQMPQGLTHIVEFEGLTMNGYPVRVMEIVMQGARSAVEVLVMMNLYRWTEFVAPCLDFVGRISLGEVQEAAPQLRAVVDEKHKDQIEYQLVRPGHQPIPLTAMPTNVGGTTIIHVDTLIQTGDINGTGIAVGSHSTATVKREQSARV